jgi:hypothetical protein
MSALVNSLGEHIPDLLGWKILLQRECGFWGRGGGVSRGD